MRLRILPFFALAPFLLIAPASAQVQTWEKLIGPGLVYRMDVDLGKPLVVHSLRVIRPNANIQLRSDLAKAVIQSPDEETKGRATLTQIVDRTKAVAGINGDFFPWTGDPLGFMVRNKELVSRPFGIRSAFAWGDNYSAAGRVTWEARAILVSGEQIPLTGLNEEVPEAGGLVLNTAIAGWAVSKNAATHVVLSQEGPMPLDGIMTLKVERVVVGEAWLKVEANQSVLTVAGAQAEKFNQLKPGELVIINSRTEGFDWEKTTSVIGGGPLLLRNGTVMNEAVAEGFNADFFDKRHPRTAIGATKEGDLILAVIDGRQPMSRGATIKETAEVMKELGAVNAINLDGGGSTQLNLGAAAINRPSDGTERPISNNVLVFGEIYAAPKAALAIRGVPRMQVGQSTTYTLVDDQGNTIPNGRIVWTAQGAGWIDQAGVLRGIRAGKVAVKAWVGGRIISTELTVEEAKKPS